MTLGAKLALRGGRRLAQAVGATGYTFTNGVDVYPVAVPTGVQSGDLMVAHLVWNATDPVTDPAGWTRLYEDNYPAFGRSILYARLAGGSEPGSYSWSTPFARENWRAMTVFRGPSSLTPKASSIVNYPGAVNPLSMWLADIGLAGGSIICGFFMASSSISGGLINRQWTPANGMVNAGASSGLWSHHAHWAYLLNPTGSSVGGRVATLTDIGQGNHSEGATRVVIF